MQLTTLWQIIIKIIGVIFAFSFFQAAIVLLQFIFMAIGLDSGQGILAFLVTVFIEGIIAFMCLFRTREVIQIFKLESSIEEKNVTVDLNTSNVIGLSIAIIGIYSLSQSIPEFFGILFSRAVEFGNLFGIVCKIALGIVMVIKTKEIERMITKYRSK